MKAQSIALTIAITVAVVAILMLEFQRAETPRDAMFLMYAAGFACGFGTAFAFLLSIAKEQ